MATRTYFCERDNQNKIYTTTNKIERFFESGLPYDQYTGTWFSVQVPEVSKFRVEQLLEADLSKFREENGCYSFSVGDVEGCDFSDSYVRELRDIEGVDIEEQCTFDGFLDTSCPNGSYLIFSRYNGNDHFDGKWELIDNDDLIKQLDEFIDDMSEDDDNDSPYFTSYVSEKYPAWSCYASHVDDQQWYDYCITIPDTEEVKEERRLDRKYRNELEVLSSQSRDQKYVLPLADHPYEKVRYKVATHVTASEDVLQKLSTDESALVRKGVAMNFYTPQQVLETLAGDKSSEVRRAVARNYNAPKKVFEILINDVEEEIRQIAKSLMDRLF